MKPAQHCPKSRQVSAAVRYPPIPTPSVRTFAEFLTPFSFGKIREIRVAVFRSFGPNFHSENSGISIRGFSRFWPSTVKGVHQCQPPNASPKKKPSASAGSGGAFKCRSGRRQTQAVGDWFVQAFSVPWMGLCGLCRSTVVFHRHWCSEQPYSCG